MKNLLTILTLLTMSGSLAAQAVSVSNTGVIGSTSTMSLTLPNFMVNANNNRLLIVCVTTISGSFIEDVKFGGTPMATIGSEEKGGPRATMFYLLLGSSGSSTTGDIVATGNNIKQIGAVAFYNVQQSNPYDGRDSTFMQAITGQTLPSTLSLNIASRSNDLVCDCFAGFANGITGITAGAGQMERVNNLSPGTPVNFGVSTEAGASPNVNMGWTLNGTLTTGQAVLLGISIRSVNAPLPIEWMSFDVYTEGGKNHLTWTTASEKDNKHFDIERSIDGNTFHSIAQVKGNNKPSNYQYTDNQPFSTTYYRLKQVDYDGTATYSKVISVTNKGGKALKVYPTLVSNGFLTVDGEGSDYAIYNIVGQQVQNGKTTQRLDVSALAKGTYILKVGTEQAKFVKQ